MKNNLFSPLSCLVILFLMLSYIFTSCKKKESAEPIPYTKPTIYDFSMTPTLPKVGEEVSFEALRSPLSVEWSFGDSTFATGTKVKHTYTKAGHYNVSMTPNGDTSKIKRQVLAVYD